MSGEPEPTPRVWSRTVLPFLSLFTSAGTLVCCALPILFVSLGLGASLAGLLGRFPQLIWLSENKSGVFGSAALLLGISGIALYRARNLPCPIEAKQALACARARRASVAIYLFSLVCFLAGGFAAFVLPVLLSE